MKTILDRIVDHKRIEVVELKKRMHFKDFESSEYFHLPCQSLKHAIQSSNFGIIGEIKRKSPSAGELQSNLSIQELVLSYENAGICAFSCLTDHRYFGGSVEDLLTLKSLTQFPVLRKEFIVDEIQLFEAKANGADAILLIAEVLTKEESLHLTIIAQSLGMEVLMEFHEQDQLFKINELVDLVGVNNRNLKKQETSISTSVSLFNFLPKDKLCISESGIKTLDEIELLHSTGYKGALIGESLLTNELLSQLTL